MHNFKSLDVWNRSIQLCKEIYLITKEFPDHEKYGLTSQIRRCTVSISSNIAEGCGRKSDKDFIRFLDIALGSAFEVETQVIIAKEIGLIDEIRAKDLESLITEIQKKIFRLVESRSKIANLQT